MGVFMTSLFEKFFAKMESFIAEAVNKDFPTPVAIGVMDGVYAMRTGYIKDPTAAATYKDFMRFHGARLQRLSDGNWYYTTPNKFDYTKITTNFAGAVEEWKSGKRSVDPEASSVEAEKPAPVKDGFPIPAGLGQQDIYTDYQKGLYWVMSSDFIEDAAKRDAYKQFMKFNTASMAKINGKWRFVTRSKDAYDKLTNPEGFVKAVDEWKQATAQTQKNVEASKATDAEIDIPVPPGSGLAYLPYQKAGVARAMQLKNVMIGDEMGLGKTMQGIGIAQVMKPKKVLIICPASLRFNWLKEWNKWDTTGLKAVVIDNQYFKKGGTVKGDGVYICGYETARDMREHFNDVVWNLMIIDEAHKLKNKDAKVTRAVYGHYEYDKKTKTEKRVAEPIEADKIVLLTGTPIPNKISELIPALQRLGTSLGSNIGSFLYKYTNVVPGYRGGNTFVGGKNLDELQMRMRDEFLIRRQKHEVLKELPKKTRKIITISPDQDEADLMELQEMLVSENIKIQDIMASGKFNSEAYKEMFMDEDGNLLENPFKILTKIKHALGVSKIPDAVSKLKDILDSKKDQKVVVMCYHNDVADSIAEQLAMYGSVKITGLTGFGLRKQNEEKLQTQPDTRVCVCTIKAAGVGITLTAANINFFVETDWVPGDIQQAEDRVHRIGQTKPVEIIYLVYKNSLDEKLLSTIQTKAELQSKALDSDTMKGSIDLDDIEINSIVTTELPTNPEKENSGVVDVAMDTRTGKIYPMMEENERRYVASALTSLAGDDADMAREINKIGFNKIDGMFGHSLVQQIEASDGDVMALSNTDMWKAVNMLMKYRKQLGPSLTSELGKIIERGKEESIDIDEYNIEKAKELADESWLLRDMRSYLEYRDYSE